MVWKPRAQITDDDGTENAEAFKSRKMGFSGATKDFRKFALDVDGTFLSFGISVMAVGMKITKFK